MDRLDLQHQIVRHRRPVGLVLIVLEVAKGLALGIKYARQMFGGVIGAQPPQHVEHAVDGAGRFAGRAAQIRHGMKGAIEIGRAVDQQQGFQGFLMCSTRASVFGGG